jgi:hypothetical protein
MQGLWYDLQRMLPFDLAFYNRGFPESCLFWLTQVSVVFVSYNTFFSLLSVEVLSFETEN